jgi:hypothetical protein
MYTSIISASIDSRRSHVQQDDNDKSRLKFQVQKQYSSTGYGVSYPKNIIDRKRLTYFASGPLLDIFSRRPSRFVGCSKVALVKDPDLIGLESTNH